MNDARLCKMILRVTAYNSPLDEGKHEARRPAPPHRMPVQEPPTHQPRAVRSFVLRAGRIGSGQQRALAELAPRYVLPFIGQPLAATTVFGRKAPLIVEIGFGMGDSTAAVAEASPAIDFLGIEVHPPGVGSLLRQIEARRLGNLRIVQHDAVAVLRQMIEPGSLAGAMLFFPDPWPKKRHHKRRLLQPPFVSLLSSRLAAGATLHCATDWEPYALQMLQVLSAEPALVNTADGFATRPTYRPQTKFEVRGHRLGHRSWDLVFRRL